MEINEEHLNETKQRVFIQSLLYNKGVSHHHLKLAEMQRPAKEWESFIVRKGKTMPWLEAVGMRKLEACELLVGYPMWLVSKCVWISPFGPEFELWAKIMEAGSHWPCPEHSGYIACKGYSSFASWADCCRGYGSEFYCHLCSDLCLLVYSVSHPCPYNLIPAKNFPQ